LLFKKVGLFIFLLFKKVVFFYAFTQKIELFKPHKMGEKHQLNKALKLGLFKNKKAL
jgi:hypothetical protein